MITVAILNRKGGVGKTSLTFHLGGQLAASGRNVLLVDMDPQASLTQAFYGPRVLEELPAEQSVAALFGDAMGIAPPALVRATSIERLRLLPGHESLGLFNLPDPRQTASSQMIIRDALEEIRGEGREARGEQGIDWVLIDCPPNLALCSWAALVAADQVLVPLAPEDFACQGITAVQKAIARIQAEANPGLRLAGLVLNQVNGRLSLHVAYEKLLRRVYADSLLVTQLPLAVAFKDAISHRKPVSHHNPRSDAAKAMASLVNELDGRIRGIRRKAA